MKTVLALLLVGSASSLTVSDELAEYVLRLQFAEFETTYSKTYATEEAREERFLTFVSNLEDVVSKNAALADLGLDEIHGITKFSDWTPEEFKTMVGGLKTSTKVVNASVAVPKAYLAKKAPSSFDWRSKNVVTDVKDQGHCGSCWAHSAVEALESQMAIAGMPLTSLSVQQVVSCDTTEDDGCGGGWYYSAWMDYVQPQGGLTTESEYPYDTATYDGRATACDADKSADVMTGSGVTGYQWATTPCDTTRCTDQDEDTLKMNLLSYGPISIAADASSWSSYTGGVMTSASCSSSSMSLDHAIQLVGYNEDADVPYWIVRNSWADTWGLDGYLYLKMGENTCGLADKPAFPNMDTATLLKNLKAKQASMKN